MLDCYIPYLYFKYTLMKNLLLLTLLIPVFCSAQKFDFSEQAGLLTTKRTHEKGFSNQVMFGYHPVKHVSVGAIYEFNSWDCQRNNSFGIAADYSTKHFFGGIDAKIATMQTIYNTDEFIESKYTPSFSYGARAGAKQALSKHIQVIEQIGYDVLPLHGTISYPPAPVGLQGMCYVGEPPLYGTFHTTTSVNYYYFRVGLSYRF